ncbi:MAG: nicotinate-nucleotide adenylyltransferase [Rhodanobacteraceae bacterium]
MIAIFGGTFDPLHLGHLRVAWEASETLQCPVRLVPARIPPHREQPVADASQRTAIVRAALAGQQRLLLDTRELDRDAPSWSVDTLLSLRSETGDKTPLVLLVGADAFSGLPKWHRWQELLALAHIGVLTRPGHAGDLPQALLDAFPDCACDSAQALHACAAGRVLHMPVTPLDISASQIRHLLASGREPRYLVADAVLEQPDLLAPYRQGGRGPSA